MLLSYKDVFTTPDQKVGLAKYGEPFRIELLPGSRPVKSRDRGLKPAQIESLKQQLKDWTADTSTLASPLVPVLKKDRSTRWAVDYRRLNQCTLPDSFPTPRIADVMEGLAGSRVFSTLDAAQAYHNVPIEPGSQDLTAFVCLFGLFTFRRMPFGLRNAGAAYCRLVQSLVDTLGCEGVLAYLDDILLHTWEVDEHIKLIHRVLQGQRDAGILLKAAKTRFFQRYVE